MGSLMAGWDSPTMDPKSATLKRNWSLTKEEIDSYWRSKKKIEEEHFRAISNLSETIKESEYEESEKRLQQSKSIPLTSTKESVDVDLKKLIIEKNVWWTKSNWAFLNEPPVTEAASSKYASQFNVANLGAPKFNPGHGISA